MFVFIKQETGKVQKNIVDSIRGEAAARSYLALVLPLDFSVERL